MNVPINALCTSGGLQHKTHNDHGIGYFKLGPFKSFILQPLWNANFLGPGGCKMKDLNGSVFYAS
jgi:hypothetical protein